MAKTMAKFTYAMEVIYDSLFGDKISKNFRVAFDTPLKKCEEKGDVLMFLKNGPCVWKVVGKVVGFSKKFIEVQFKEPLHDQKQVVTFVF